MKNLFGLLISCLLISATAYAQESREADAERMRNAREVNARNPDERSVITETFDIFTKVDLIFSDKKMSVQSSKSEGKIGGTYASRTYPEIDRLSKMDLSAESEIDFLNYMGENNWNLNTVIVNVEDKMTRKTMYFSKSMPEIKSRTATR